MTKRDRFFNPLRQGKTASAKALIADVIRQLQGYESHLELRKRSRKKRDLEIFNRQIEAIICEAVHRHLTGADKRIAISLSNRHLSRKDSESKILNNTLSQNIKNLASPEMAFIELQAGNQKTGEVTSFWAGKRLKTRINERKLTYLDLTLEKTKNVIELRETKAHGQAKGKLIKYPETALTIQYRDEMEQINAFLRDADICYQGNKDIDDSRVELKRIFNNGSFEQGARLYGAFWLNLCPEDKKEITIDDEWVVSLDYGQMAVRLAYSLAKAPIVFDDGYLIPNWEKAREATKKLINVMLNSTSSDDWSVPKKVQKLYPYREHIERHLITDIYSFHKPIAHLFGGQHGMKFMFLESEILIDVLLELNSKGIVALPIHDCILVKESAQQTAKEVMLKVFKKHTNLDATVAVEAL
uniref:hypothetical protein n=1 Tax=Polynucleobacter sp. TaxID=2029855 RepID=UPI00404707B5